MGHCRDNPELKNIYIYSSECYGADSDKKQHILRLIMKQSHETKWEASRLASKLRYKIDSGKTKAGCTSYYAKRAFTIIKRERNYYASNGTRLFIYRK